MASGWKFQETKTTSSFVTSFSFPPLPRSKCTVRERRHKLFEHKGKSDKKKYIYIYGKNTNGNINGNIINDNGILERN